MVERLTTRRVVLRATPATLPGVRGLPIRACAVPVTDSETLIGPNGSSAISPAVRMQHAIAIPAKGLFILLCSHEFEFTRLADLDMIHFECTLRRYEPEGFVTDLRFEIPVA